MRKDEFMREIEDCRIPESFDQRLLDNAATMFGKWGMTRHVNETEHLFESAGLAAEKGDNEVLKKEKEALRCICKKMMNAKLNREDAATIIRNFNRINDPSYEWIDR